MDHKYEQTLDGSNPNCYLCNNTNTHDFLSLPPIPTMDGVMCNSKEAALKAVRGQILLRFCNNCGFIGNEAYDPAKVSFDEYDFSNAHSPLFAKHTREISDHLINKYRLHEKNILDIGCGDGYFLKTICERGQNKGIGIEPGFDLSHLSGKGVELSFIRDYYSEKHAVIEADLVTSRHVLSVINDPVTYISIIRKNLESRPDTIVYFDAPYADYTFKERVIWNIVYENRSWFSESSFKYLLERCGFEVLDIASCWNGEYLGIEAKPDLNFTPPGPADKSKVRGLAAVTEAFSNEFQKIKAAAKESINQMKAQQKRSIAWGAGARGISFFNLFDLSQEVPYIVDVNVNRQNKYLPGSAQKIVAPEFITAYQPDLVIITNPSYAKEIMAQTKSLGVDPEFWVL